MQGTQAGAFSAACMLLKQLLWQEAAASAKAEDNKRRRTADGMKRKERDSTADGSSKASSKVPFCRKSQSRGSACFECR